MKFSKFCFTLATAVFAAGAFADAANVLISFSTTADTYADGTPVKDGEWYALCWSPRETFSGLDLNYNTLKSDEKLLILAPLAEGGRCPSVMFQVDSKKAPTGGNYFVYLLDTRDVTGNTVANAKIVKTEDNTERCVPDGIVNGSAEAGSYKASASVGSSIVSDAGTTSVATGGWSAVQPKITAFEVKGAKVKITVAGMMSGLTYKVNMGKDLNEMETFAVEAPQTEDGKAFFIIDPDDARFFKVKAVAE